MTGTTAHGDNIKSTWGTLPDLEIYHDGSDSIITDVGEGGVKIFTAGVNDSGFYKVGGETLATFEPDGAVTLYHNDNEKLATTSTGVDVTGVITTDGLTTSADISFGDNVKAQFGAGNDLQIYHSGSTSYIQDAGTGDLKILSSNDLWIEGINGEPQARFAENGACTFYYDNASKLATSSAGIDVTGRAKGTLTTDNDGSFDMSASNNFKCTPSGNFTLTFTNIVSQSGFILLVNSGGHTVSAHANSKVDANLLATVTAAGTYLISYFSDGTNVYLTNSAIYT